MKFLKKFTSIYFLSLIIRSFFIYLARLEVVSAIKLCIFSIVFLIVFTFNKICLLLDRLFFDFVKVNVKKPFFIVGFPRSGTTFLHKTILKDSQFTTPKLWELIFAPSIIQKKIYFSISKKFKRYNFVNVINFLLRPFVKSLDNVHEVNLSNPEEDYLFLLPFGGCFLLSAVFPVLDVWKLCDFDRKFELADRLKLFEKYKLLVKRHLYYHGKNKIYLSKNPHFTGFIESLKIIFPDCNILGCHRDPLKSLPSVLSSMEPPYRLMSRNVKNDLNLFIDMLDIYTNCLIRQDNDKFLFVSMEKIKNELEATILKIYNKFNYKTNPDVLNIIKIESRISKKFVTKNDYSLKYYDIDKVNFRSRYKKYYLFFEKLK
ncbi:MAG: hypothetical protein CMG00_06645 [Candidatus Marinimicrobia bacterium]|nr:hypothetical protein [Candidatus Neomarinimicrobiota bacterium]